MSEIEYLAIPYSDPDPEVMDYRAEISDIICADLMNQGRVIFAPISSCHHIAKKHTMPRDWEFWKNIDEQFVRASKTLLVVALEGGTITNNLSNPDSEDRKPVKTQYIMGASLKEIEQVTENGTKYGLFQFQSMRELPYEEVRDMGLECFTNAEVRITQRLTRIFFMGDVRYK